MTRPLGTPTWLDLGTTDLAAAKAFYEQLLGWDFADTGADFGHYQMISKDGGLVGGAMDVSGMSCPDGGEPPASAWDVYLAVDDVDARLALAQENGARVLFPASDVPGAGRCATVADPAGAAVAMWQAAGVDGYEFTGQSGTPVWFELMTQDFDAASTFYQRVFDFQPAMMASDENPDWRYATNGSAEQASSGMCDASGFIPAEVGSYWRAYFAVADCDAAASRVTELGGTVLDGPIDSPFGRLVTIADPTGASCQLIDPSRRADDRPMR